MKSEYSVAELVRHSGARLSKPLRYALSNLFAFGGNNIALLPGRV